MSADWMFWEGQPVKVGERTGVVTGWHENWVTILFDDGEVKDVLGYFVKEV